MLTIMARKSQQFRYEEERKHTKKKPAAKPAAKKKVAKPAAKKEAKDRPYALEDVAAGKRPSRKSTRTSPDHQKGGAQLKNKVTLKVISPSSRKRAR
jgi:hypothetical protein